ncbi:MAG: monovalent cation/H+ antiporter complex subunit F [Desulfurococcaceae archaeon]
MNEYLSLVLAIASPFYIVAAILYSYRAIKGPTIPDIVLAIDCISYDLAVFLAILALYYRSPIMISPAIILALWAYLLDIYISKHLIAREIGV